MFQYNIHSSEAIFSSVSTHKAIETMKKINWSLSINLKEKIETTTSKPFLHIRTESSKLGNEQLQIRFLHKSRTKHLSVCSFPLKDYESWVLEHLSLATPYSAVQAPFQPIFQTKPGGNTYWSGYLRSTPREGVLLFIDHEWEAKAPDQCSSLVVAR